MDAAFGQRRNGRRRYLFLFLSESLVLCLLWAVLAGPDLDMPSSLHRLLQKWRKGMLRRHAHAPAAPHGIAVHSLCCAAVQLLFCARRLWGCSHVLPAISFLIVLLAAVAWLCRVTGAGLGRPGGLRYYFLFFLWRLLPPILKDKEQPEMTNFVYQMCFPVCVSRIMADAASSDYQTWHLGHQKSDYYCG